MSLYLTIPLALIIIYSVYTFLDKKKTVVSTKEKDKLTEPVIVPIGNEFKWQETKPYPYRPFKKGPYKMNLAIRKLDPNDIIVLEDDYVERIDLRLKLFDETKLYGIHESCFSAVRELYLFVFNFLIKRYPQYFELTDNGTLFYNKIFDKKFPYNPIGLTEVELCRNITHNIEEDFLIMIKNSEEKEYDEYVLRAAVSLHPSGFNPIEKLNMPLTKVHGPVPGYVEKLQFSMNKFFARLKKYEFVVRNNWSFQTHTNLCAPSGSQSHATMEDMIKIHPLAPNDLDFNKCFFRVEKQCFTRLPETGGDLMFIRTYVTSLMELRSELTEEQKNIFCDAIDGMTGEFGVYKRRIEWGEAVKSFVRGESNGSQPIPTKYKFVH
ncbi:hypothetical protein C6P42_001904 [Pichia californica]|nr:hypothetical protein C6P42_001904 [[Candida] californica]